MSSASKRQMQRVPIEELNRRSSGTMGEVLGIEFTEVTEQSLTAKMPVDLRTRQIHGILHGGASVVLAETLGSVGTMLCLISEGKEKQFRGVGLEINANHISAVASGWVTGVAQPIHLGKSTHVWEIRITSEAGKLVCISRLTVAVISQQPS
jgi:1,4-dihydroxy-2-naphthoyl-CoA hydrolase